MIKWILQKNLTKPEILTRIKSVLIHVDETWEEVEIAPFSNELLQLTDKDSFNIIYGSTTFMLNAFNDETYNSGVFYNPETFQMKNYVEQWKEHVLNSSGQLVAFGELDEIESSSTQKWFIRPNHDGKEFSGKVEAFEELIHWKNRICQLDLPDFNAKTEVWISEPKAIKKEWRLFVVDDKIVSASRYAVNGELSESATDIPIEMLNFSKERISEYRLHDVYVMDIAEIENEFQLIECNCFNGTGFYQHDIEAVIRAVTDLVREKYC